MKSLVDLLAVLLQECGRKCGAPVARDVETLRARVTHEGNSFITITLPAFCSDFERSLDQGRVAPGSFLSFRKERSGTPSFLKGFLRYVFGADGNLLNEPSIDCIRVIRQICLFGKKVRLSCSPERMEAAIEGYAKCDRDIMPPDPHMHWYLKRVSAIICGTLFGDEDFRSSLIPTHGPGATQEGISGNQKWLFKRWHRRLTRVGFTYARFGRASYTGLLPCRGHRLDSGEIWPDVIEPEDEEPVRVHLVPKTLKTPRIIAIEPVCMQYAQQALSRYLVRRLQSCRFTAGHVNFSDQSVNQVMALGGSMCGHLATLDMSEASDRVSTDHVATMLDTVPDFRDWVFATRSTRAKLPNGDVITLKKFASMGSALCFPIESMIFYMSIIASRIRRAGFCPTPRLVMKYSRDVYVFGDDLIVPADEAPVICEDLESLGFKVNRRKSFWTGKFRESCGVDAYDGVPVTPVYLRSLLPADHTDAERILSNVATCNQLIIAGYTDTALVLRRAIEGVLGKLPEVPHHDAERVATLLKRRDVVLESPAIGWVDHSEAIPPTRWNRHLQRTEYLCWVPVSKWRKDPLDGFPALAKSFRLIGSQDPIDQKHLLRSVRPYSLALKRRWVELPNLESSCQT